MPDDAYGLVYGLADVEGRVRYVGQTRQTLAHRLKHHRGTFNRASRKGEYAPSLGLSIRTRPLTQWAKSVGGYENISIVLLEKVAGGQTNLDHAEARWIERLPDLVNSQSSTLSLKI